MIDSTNKVQEHGEELTVLFADIAGSTHLYELMGDEFAKELISKTLEQLSDIVTSLDGKTIKTIGDEIMCGFPTANQAVLAARQMHEYLAEKTIPAHNYNLSVRVGAHYGPIINSNGDIFGDTVNVSARVTSLACAGKTMITWSTYKQLLPVLQENCRLIMQTKVKGKDQPIDIYDVVWEQDDELTSIHGHSGLNALSNVLTLQYQDTTVKISAKSITSVLIGRGPNCDLIVPAPLASREHCRITYNLGKFVLDDHSTNGTYLYHDNNELFIQHEKTPLLNSGFIGIGESTSRNRDFLLNYSIE